MHSKLKNMNSVAPITPNSITGLAHLDQRPVFFIKLNNQLQPSLVIKGETGIGQDVELSVKWGSKFMKNINDNRVNTKILDAAEVNEFRRGVQVYGDPNKRSYASLNDANTTWVKMPFVAGLSDADTWDDDGRKSTNDIKDIISKFTKPEVWVDLGKVIAVDLFNGNNDRFDTNGDWINKGNIMFTPKAGGGLKVIGLDTYQPQNATSNLVAHGRFPELDILKTPLARRNFAIRVTQSITTEIAGDLFRNGVHSVTVGFPPNMFRFNKDNFNPFSVFIDDLEAGLIAGAAELKNYLLQKKRQYAPPAPARGVQFGAHRGAPLPPPPAKTIPAGILDRMRYLEWN